MRPALVLVVTLCADLAVAAACPSATDEVSTDHAPSTTACFTDIDWRSVRRLVEVRYALGASGEARSGIGNMASAFAALELALALQFGSDPAAPSYEIELAGGGAAQRYTGAVDATGLATRAGFRLGPARLAATIVDEGRTNAAFFPLTMELAHSGELAARPRIGSRPELARAQYNRQRVELATRMLRVEGAGEKPATTAPGATPPRRPSARAIDLFPLHAGIDVAAQDTTRVDATIGGSLLGIVDHDRGGKLDLLRLDHRHTELTMQGPVSLVTVWMLRLDGVDPGTGTGYRIGWGEVIVSDELADFARAVDPEDERLAIGGIGWYSERAWGGYGVQYQREPYIAITGEIGLEDRVAAEVYVPRWWGLVGRAYGARTKRLAGDVLAHDVTMGLEVGATYAGPGWSSKLGVELGRTFYTMLDETLPTTTGFVASFGATLQHTGSRAWLR